MEEQSVLTRMQTLGIPGELENTVLQGETKLRGQRPGVNRDLQ